MHALTRVAVVAWLSASGVLLAQTQSQGLICAVDLNGDGMIDQPNEQGVCTTYPTGSLCPIQAQACVANATGAMTCPSSPSSACINTGTGGYLCSPNPCLDPSQIPKTVTTVNALAPPANNGPVASDGACLGTLVIFPGTVRTCNQVGVQTNFTNCCDTSNAVHDTVGAPGESAQVPTVQNAINQIEQIVVPHCSPNDEGTALQKNSGECIALGTQCGQSWGFLGCAQTEQTMCCFNSMLARIIQQQGRPQLPEMGDFGTPKKPNCRGFTPQEFQSLDFSKIDFSQYTAQLRTLSQSAMEHSANAIATQRLSAPQ